MKRHLPTLVLLILLAPAPAEGQPWTWTWTRKTGFAGLADPFCANPLNPATIFSSPGNSSLVVSRDAGRTWTVHSVAPGGNQVKSIAIHALDSLLVLAAQEGDTTDRIIRSTDGGVTWTTTLTGRSYYFGHPLAYEPLLQSGLVYTMLGNVVYRSQNFGLTWDSVAATPFGSSNGGWEDAFIRPDSASILFAADNATGIWKSENGGATWRRVHAASGEVPALALNRQHPAVAYASRWGGGGGFLKTTDYGTTWLPIAQFTGLNTWGAATAPDHPDMVAFGTWGPVSTSGGGIHISRDAGATWEHTFTGLTSLNNHAVFFADTTNLLSLWGNGIWKLRRPGRIAGAVFTDLNGDGVRDSADQPRAGLRMRLGGTRTDSLLTDAAGAYVFGFLAAGGYRAAPAIPAGWSISTPPPPGGDTLVVTDGEEYPDTDFGLTAPAILSGAASDGWNLVSVPVIPADPTPPAVFPAAVSQAFLYGPAGYTPSGSLETGRGYWLKFSGAQNLLVGGGLLDADTVAVVPGWNLIGAPGIPVEADSVLQSPPGIVVSSFFGFGGSSYTIAGVLEPFGGYWVKCAEAGVLILRGGSRELNVPD